MTKEEMAIRYYENSQAIEALKAENEKLKEMMLESMATEETDTIMAGHIKAMSKTVKKTTFESARFKKDYEDLYEEYAKHGYSTRFTVNYIK